MINNQASSNDQFNPRLAVDETDGTLMVIYYDTVGDSGRQRTDVWYQSSANDGATWATPVRVTTAMTDETTSGGNAGNEYGDYNGLSGYAGRFFPSWTDRRGGGREEIWTAPITSEVVAAEAAAGAPAASESHLAGQDPCARVVYRGTDGHIHELYYLGGTASWGHGDLTAVTGAPFFARSLVASMSPKPSGGVVF